MVIDDSIRQMIAIRLLDEAYLNMPLEKLKNKIIHTPLNLLAIISYNEGDKSTLLLRTFFLPQKLAKVLNSILVLHFESVQEFCDVVGISREEVMQLWSNTDENYKPDRYLIKTLIREWHVHPEYLYGDRRKMFFE